MSHWKQRKPQWAIELSDSCSLICRNGSTALYRTKKDAVASMARSALYQRQYRIVKVWVKYEEVQS
jgi:hypothetical protein